MKKIVSTIVATIIVANSIANVSIIVSAFPVNSVFAVEISKNKMTPNVYKTADTNKSDINLYELASSLGADTDYFNFPNYNVEIPEKEIMDAFRRNITQNEAILNIPQLAQVSFMEAGGCNGFSILQILTHNGVIPVSAIQNGAETLHDVQFDKSVNDIIAYYQMTQKYLRQDFTIAYDYCNHTTEQQISHLIETAENAMKNNRYFYITFNMSIGSHAIVGIGCADGEWTYNDKSYNKCILTLDSNHSKKDGSGGGFTEFACIYINTSDNSFYIPAYEADESNTSFRSIIDDDNILNYKGLIAPSSDDDVPPVDNITAFEIDNNAESRVFSFTIVNDDKSEQYQGTYEDFMLTPKDFYVSTFAKRKFYIDSADCYKFDVSSIDEKDLSSICHLHFDTETLSRSITAFGDFSAEASENKLSVTSKSFEDNTSIELKLSSENGLYKNSRFCQYSVWGRCDGTVSIEERPDGILVKHDAPLDAKITFLGTKIDSDGLLTFYDGNDINQIGYEIYSTADNLWKYDEERDDIVCFVDSNDDGIFDKEVVTGDVNCDGFIDAVDASKVLEIYAELSTNNSINPNVIMKKYGDYNDDGYVDANDASMILAKYAELSVSKN